MFTPPTRMVDLHVRTFYVNLAVENLAASVAFWAKLGFSFDPRLTGEHHTCMVVSDEVCVLLLEKELYTNYILKDICNTTTHSETVIALSAPSREAVDEFADRAYAAGAQQTIDPMDFGHFYGRSFQDPDGHLWEMIWLDETKFDPIQIGRPARSLSSHEPSDTTCP